MRTLILVLALLLTNIPVTQAGQQDVPSSYGYSQDDYPQLPVFQDDVRKLYNDFLAIKRTEPFFHMGMLAPAAKQWKTELQAAEQKYKKIRLPYQVEETFLELSSMAMEYALARAALRHQTTYYQMDSREELIAIHRKRVEEALQLRIDSPKKQLEVITFD
jgi:hypothetical protein